MSAPPFHLAMPVHDLEEARAFYTELLGCTVGRSADTWLDLDFFGHQLSLHRLVDAPRELDTNLVDGDGVPVPHFGAVLPWAEWHATSERLVAAGAPFILEPRVRFKGETGEQATLFLRDPSGNAIELKSFEDPSQLFASA